ncbi:3'(2'),5'-bisphosphate nucleotidase CysQ [Rhizomicrobium electricum]|uniref:3'(2'),5'-bisphosphate nucleotidase CysQ n=1 Tax=Rhizomicrobium electricum TaxID=480070 RepID=A0ABN1E604_9PROT|nr:3'(2'),5'-bisphosphate nucleotidase CysQ [Rhizomicrobium electricum]NIJ47743.1 myo-inositol-1(or 4)-monophosphatase [Rhizomicrobium electricum]
MPERDLELVAKAVREAGAIAREIYAGHCKTWAKSDGSPVTEADLAVNKYLTEHLRGARPDYAWLSEESEDDRSRFSAKRIFVVDPIDGTLAFVKRRPHFTVSVAIVEDGQPVTACVYNPITDECFTAAAGEGAFLNGDRIHVTAKDTLDGCNILASRKTLSDPRWNAPWPEMHVDNPNSIAYRVALVAAGKFDAGLTLAALHDWDLAAADLVVREAGGILTSIEGELPLYNRENAIQPSAMAAGPKLHAVLLSRLDNAPRSRP